MSEHVVLIGARGWQHNDWIGEFYPDDLPDDWRLGYYGNEYPVVMVPASYLSADESEYEQWLEESDDSLRMIVEWPAQGAGQQQVAAAQKAVELLAQRVMAIMIPVESDITESDYTIYKELAASYPVCFDVTLEQRAQLLPWLAEHFANDDYSVCWRADLNFKQDLEFGTVAITRTFGNIAPKDLRVLLETMIAATNPERHMVLIVEGEPPSMQLLTNASIILDLL